MVTMVFHRKAYIGNAGARVEVKNYKFASFISTDAMNFPGQRAALNNLIDSIQDLQKQVQGFEVHNGSYVPI